jgi:death-on-curing protein
MPVWLNSPEIKFYHRELIEEHGGLTGLKDDGALEATLARPHHLCAYKPDSTIHQLATSYGFGFAKNHVFVDGNKRVALAAINIFLQVNGANLAVDEVEAVIVINDVAAGLIDEDALAAWIAEKSVPFDIDAD